MTVNISLTPETESRIRVRAAASGQPVNEYVAHLVAQAASRPTLEELLPPVQADFAKSGMTESELLELGRELLVDVRRNKHAR